MESGSLLDSGCGPITPEHAIDYKDLFSKNLGCSESENVLECLQVCIDPIQTLSSTY